METTQPLPAHFARHRRRAIDTILHNVRSFCGETIVWPSPTYEGFWARDTMIVALGLLDAGHVALAGDLLRTWASYAIRPDDDTRSYAILNKHRLDWTEREIETAGPAWLEQNRGGLPTCVYVGRPEYPNGTREIYSCHPDPDSTAWWLVAWGRYVALSGDRASLDLMRPALQNAMDCLARRDSDEDLLIEQCPNEDWADHMRRHGKVTYTQAVWYGAVQAAAVLGLKSPPPGDVRHAIRTALLGRTARPLDWQCPQARSERVAQDSALLILLGVLDPVEGACLLRRLTCLASPHGHRVVAPAFRRSRMGPYHFRRGEYQNAGIWTWLTGWEAQARALLGDRDGALQLIDGCLCPTCCRIYEWIEPTTGHRYNPDFATGAGSILSALARVEESIPDGEPADRPDAPSLPSPALPI